MSTISASTTTTTAFRITTDTAGTLVFQTGSTPTTAMTLGSDQSVTFAGTPTYSGGTANGVAYLNGSKVFTTGTSLAFDGTNFLVGTNTATALAGYTVVGQFKNSVGIVSSNDEYAGAILRESSTSNSISINADPGNLRANSVLIFKVDGTEDARIDAAGNFGLGVTPSAWSGVGAVLQVGTSAAIIGNSASSSSFISNAYYDGAAYKFIGAGFAARLALTSGAYSFQTSSTSGSAGGTVTFTAGMTLDASGRLQIGTTSTGAGQRLIVDSNGASTVYNSNFTFSGTTNTAYCATTWTHGQSGTATGYVGVGGSAVANTAFANNFVVGTQSSSPLVFNTNDTERARIDSSGNFLLGTTSSVASGMTIGNATGARSINGVVNGGGFSINATDTVNSPSAGFSTGHITSTSQYAVRVGSTGGLQLNGAGATAWTALSDETTKDIIEPITDAANKVSTLRAVIGKYKTDEEGVRRSFLIAQDVQAVLPEAVSSIKKELDSEETALGLAYTDIIPLLVAAIQELNTRLEALEAK